MKGVKKFMDCWDYSNEELLEMVDLIIRLRYASAALQTGC